MRIQDKDKLSSEFRAGIDGFNISAELPLDMVTYSIERAVMLILREANDCGIEFKAYVVKRGHERVHIDPDAGLHIIASVLNDREAFALIVNTDNHGVAGVIQLLAAFVSEPGEDRAYRLGLSAASIGKAFESEAGGVDSADY